MLPTIDMKVAVGTPYGYVDAESVRPQLEETPASFSGYKHSGECK
jgi:precorrin isomerase